MHHSSRLAYPQILRSCVWVVISMYAISTIVYMNHACRENVNSRAYPHTWSRHTQTHNQTRGCVCCRRQGKGNLNNTFANAGRCTAQEVVVRTRYRRMDDNAVSRKNVLVLSFDWTVTKSYTPTHLHGSIPFPEHLFLLSKPGKVPERGRGMSGTTRRVYHHDHVAIRGAK